MMDELMMMMEFLQLIEMPFFFAFRDTKTF